MTTKGQLRAAGMSDAQAKTIPEKATRGYMLYGSMSIDDARPGAAAGVTTNTGSPAKKSKSTALRKKLDGARARGNPFRTATCFDEHCNSQYDEIRCTPGEAKGSFPKHLKHSSVRFKALV
eukprot:gene1160-biopygen9913